ncbi:MAG: beta-propeller domain-containing protein [Eubacteriales bacterium]|nr:beta-propeller domain-containing protein [Eubacteriales bacterium]
MFKEQYIRDNDKLKAKETLLMEIKEKNTREKIALTPRQKFVRYGAVFAAFVLVAAGVFGVTQLGKGTSATPENATLAATADSTDVREVTSYDDLYGLIESMQNNNTVYAGGVMMESAVADGAAVAEAPREGAAKSNAAVPAPTTEAGSADYSETNVQVKGVDEADIVKTDGNFIYYIAGNQLNILKPDGAGTKLISSTQLSSDDSWWGYNSEMFLLGNRLMIITQSYNTVWINDANGNYQTNTDQTSAIIYDVSNPTKPAQVVSLGQSGNYVSSRMIGDYVYLVTSQYIYNAVKGTPVTYIPSTSDGAESKLLQPTDLYIGGNPQNAAYTVIGSINLKSGANFTSAKAVFGGTSELYANADHLLLAFSRYEEETQPIAPDKDGKNVQITRSSSSTDLVLLGLAEGQITKLASGNVPGNLLNQFSMDEYQNVIRIVTTLNNWEQRIYTDGIDTYESDSTSANALYTLDLNLNVLGKIENLAKDEYVKSVRFDGDIGYFVTFRQVDPLFAVDLSNAANPRILDTLKIPGFSEYLHVFKDNLLLGIGYNADEKTGQMQGVKLSMFDTADKTNVKEVTTEKVDASWTAVGSNHKAILVDAEKNLIAFPADSNYYIYRYTADKGFTLAARVNMAADLSSWNLRGLFIGDYFYVLGDSGVTVISLSDFSVLTTVKLGK